MHSGTSAQKAAVGSRNLHGRARLWAGMGLSTVCLWLALKEVEPARVWAVLAQTRYGFVLPALALVVVSPLVRAVRWQLLLSPHRRRFRLSKLFAILIIGQMVNIALPARLGELARAHLLRELEGESRAFALGTIAVEKLMDMMMLLLAFLAVIPFIPVPVWLRGATTGVTATTAVLFLGAIVFARFQSRWLAVLGYLLALLPGGAHAWLAHHIKLALDGLETLRRWDVGLAVLGWSALIGVFSAVINYLTFLALGIHLPFFAALFLLVVLQAGIAVPSAPGKVGIFQYLCVLALSTFSVERSLAFGYGVLLYLIVFLPPSVLGALFLWWESLTLHSLKRAALETELGSGGPP